MKLGIVNYGLGNIRSIVNAIEFTSKDCKIKLLNTADELQDQDKLILPGVGAFGDAADILHRDQWVEGIENERKKGKYILGICLGMQLLASKSYEFGEFKGLNFISGEVKRIPSQKGLRIPHIGWNSVYWEGDYSLFKDIESGADFYFVHSYYFQCTVPQNSIGETTHGLKFSSVVQKENVIGTQFHPEKSQKNGIQLINNFIDL